jgi:hypothetical protein
MLNLVDSTFRVGSKGLQCRILIPPPRLGQAWKMQTEWKRTDWTPRLDEWKRTDWTPRLDWPLSDDEWADYCRGRDEALAEAGRQLGLKVACINGTEAPPPC